MPRNRFVSTEHMPVGVLFLIGGEEKSPVYRQLGYLGNYAGGVLVPYDRGTAAVDKMINDRHPFTPVSKDTYTVRDSLISIIDEQVVNASEIEDSRQAVADALNKLAPHYSID